MSDKLIKLLDNLKATGELELEPNKFGSKTPIGGVTVFPDGGSDRNLKDVPNGNPFRTSESSALGVTAILSDRNLKTDGSPMGVKTLANYQPDEKGIIGKYKKHLKIMSEVFWSSDEIEIKDDLIHLTKMTAGEVMAIKKVLMFFAFADAVVADNISINFEQEVEPFYIKACYRFCAMIEDVHSETYQKLLISYFPDEHDELSKKVYEEPAINKKIRWMAKWMASDAPFAQRVLAFMFVEGIFFLTSFAVIFWFSTRGLMPNNAAANRLINRDECYHTTLAQMVFLDTGYVVDEAVVHEMARDAVEVEAEFAAAILPKQIEDINSNILRKYAEFIADTLLSAIKYKKLFNTPNPCGYMDNLGIEPKTNTFEVQSSQYKQVVLNKPELLEDF